MSHMLTKMPQIYVEKIDQGYQQPRDPIKAHRGLLCVPDISPTQLGSVDVGDAHHCHGEVGFLNKVQSSVAS